MAQGNLANRADKAKPVTREAVMGQVPFLAAAFSQIFSDTRAFVAAAELQLPAPDGETPTAIPFVVTMLDGKMRFDLHLSPSNRVGMLPEEVDSLRNLGLDRMTLQMQQGKDVVLSLPSLKTYVTLPMPKDAALNQQAQLKTGQLQRQPAGSEVVDGRACNKFLVTLAGDAARKEQATVWEARDLANLPVKLRVKTGDGSTYGLQFKAVRMQRSDPRLFDPPAGFTKQKSFEAALQAAALRLLAPPK